MWLKLFSVGTANMMHEKSFTFQRYMELFYFRHRYAIQTVNSHRIVYHCLVLQKTWESITLSFLINLQKQ